MVVHDPDNPNFDKEKSIGFLVHEVARLFRRRFEDEARTHNVTLPQWRALIEIFKNEGISQVSLAGCIDTDPMGEIRRLADEMTIIAITHRKTVIAPGDVVVELTPDGVRERIAA